MELEDKDDGDGYQFLDKAPHSLKPCIYEQHAPFTDKVSFNKWYPNAVCFTKSSDIKMFASWWQKKFVSPAVLVATCNEIKRKK